MSDAHSNRQILTKLMFSLLPVQVLISMIGAINGIVSSYFATNYIGITAMSAVGIYGPLNLIVTTSASILTSGAGLLCGKYLGQNNHKKVNNIFSLDLIIAGGFGAVLALLYVIMGTLDLTGFLTRDPEVRVLFNAYLLGQAVGLIPYMLGSQLTIFLSLENRPRWTLVGSITYIAVNLVLNVIFVKNMGMGAFGLALAAGIGLWAFFFVQALFYITGRSGFGLRLKNMNWSEIKTVIGIGLPTSATYLYQALRAYIVNILLAVYVGSVGISAFTTANNVMAIFWSVHAGMMAVSRMVMGISIGEEDRQSLTDMMRVILGKYMLVMFALAAGIAALSWPLTYIFFRDPSEPVFAMTRWGLLLLPFAMPPALAFASYITYSIASGKRLFVSLMSAYDGAIGVVAFSLLLMPVIPTIGVYVANILNGVFGMVLVIAFSWVKNGKRPTTIDEYMLIPADFGVPENERIDLTITNEADVINLSQKVQMFCLNRGIDERRAYLSGLAIEEMAGNIVEHGFTKDNRKHAIDIRISHKTAAPGEILPDEAQKGDSAPGTAAGAGDKVIIRLRDNCRAFDPASRTGNSDPDDPAKNIGIRMIYGILEDVEYQNILGLNVLMMKI